MSLGDYVCLGVDACLLALSYVTYRSSIKNLNAVKDAPLYEIGSSALHDELVRNRCVPYAVIRGVVKALERPIVSQNVPSISGVILEHVLREHQVRWSWTARWWTDATRDISRSTTTVPFVLLAAGGAVVGGVEVSDPLSALGLELDTVYDHFRPSVVATAWDAIGSFFRGEVSKGLQEVERMLSEGSVLTGIGALALGHRSGVVELRPPGDGFSYFLTTASVDAIVKQLQSSADWQRRLVALFGVVGSVLLAKILLQLHWERRESASRAQDVQRLREVQLQRLRRSRRGSSATLQRPSPPSGGGDDDEQLCRVCLVNPREVVLLECGHVCCCVDCAMALEPKLCPVCRAPIERLLPAYVA